MQATPAQIRKCAIQIVDFYVGEITMNLLLQGELEREIIADFARAPDFEAADWVTIVNGLLDGWERTHATKGPRITSIAPATGSVTGKRRPTF